MHGTNHKIEYNYIKSMTTGGEYESAHLYSSYPYRDILDKNKIQVKGDGHFVLSYNQKIISRSLKRICLHSLLLDKGRLHDDENLEFVGPCRRSSSVYEFYPRDHDYQEPRQFRDTQLLLYYMQFLDAKALVSIGEQEEGKKLFQRLVDKINHLGLLSEDIDFKTGRLLGNFPQGYSHLALIDTALVLTHGQTPRRILSKRLSREERTG